MPCLINSCFTKFFWGEIQCSPVSWYVSYRDFAGDTQPYKTLDFKSTRLYKSDEIWKIANIYTHYLNSILVNQDAPLLGNHEHDLWPLTFDPRAQAHLCPSARRRRTRRSSPPPDNRHTASTWWPGWGRDVWMPAWCTSSPSDSADRRSDRWPPNTRSAAHASETPE